MRDDPKKLAKEYILAEQYKKGKEILLPLANNNDDEAQLILGYLYYGGDSDTSAEEAKFWLQRSSENGNIEAMYYIATTNFEQNTTSPDPQNEKSFALLQEAANKGSAEAQRNLAILYAHGEIVPQDDKLTMFWDEKAAKQGLADSQHDLALMLLTGYGEDGVRDIPSAIYWYEQAAREDHNVPYAQWAAEALAKIFAGEPDPQYINEEKSEYWKKRSRYLETIDFRPHPNWFYN